MYLSNINIRHQLFVWIRGLIFGCYVFFLKKYSYSQCRWKKYSDFGGGKKKYDSEFLSYNLMLNSGNKINILALVLSEKKILSKTKNHNPPPPLQVKWSVPCICNTSCLEVQLEQVANSIWLARTCCVQ